MVNRQLQSSPQRSLLKNEEQPFDHAITAMAFLVFGSFLAVLGTAMTILAYAYEKRPNFTSVAESIGFRTDIAGPVILSCGGAGILLGFILISSCGVCAPPDWSNRKVSPMEPTVVHGLTSSPHQGRRY